MCLLCVYTFYSLFFYILFIYRLCVYCVYLLCIYRDTHTYSIYFESIYMYLRVYIYIYDIGYKYI